MTAEPERQRTLDEEHLRLLSLFYYISAGIAAFFAIFPAIYIVIGFVMIVASHHASAHPKDVPPAFVGWLMVVVGLFVSLLLFAIAAAKFFTGKWLQERTHREFCLVIAGLSCLSMPYGTVLGVFTFIVLFRDSVKPLFGLRGK